jgi:hypothetical protein
MIPATSYNSEITGGCRTSRGFRDVGMSCRLLLNTIKLTEVPVFRLTAPPQPTSYSVGEPSRLNRYYGTGDRKRLPPHRQG